MKYFFRRKWEQIQRVIDFLPIIWKGYDFDYRYSLELFQHQLKRQADFLESKRAMTVEAKNNAKRIRTAITLMKKVYDEDYGMEYMDKIDALYGKTHYDFVPTDNVKEYGAGTYTLKIWNESAVNDEHQKEIDEVSHQMMIASNEKQEKAHRILWEFIAHNIRHWWD
jgi:hypothetical protein